MMMRGDRPVCIPWAGSRRARLGRCAACRRVGRGGRLCCRFRFRGSRRGRWGGVSVAFGGGVFSVCLQVGLRGGMGDWVVAGQVWGQA